jgi:predicted RNase H-like HicB family nuclease
MQYVVVIEKSDNGYSAYVPDLPGCIAAASTKSETEKLIREAIQLHLGAMRDDDEAIPEPTSSTVLVEA